MTEFEQTQLTAILRKSKPLTDALRTVQSCNLPNCYVAAGCIIGTVWNDMHGFPLTDHIKDCDVVYFDPSDLSKKSEENTEQRIRELLPNSPWKIDVKNEARVHLWYGEKFGVEIKPYTSTEDAIGSWPTTVNSVGVRLESSGELKVYSSFGLSDLLSLHVRPNKRQAKESVYNEKSQRWQSHWPKLTIEPWNNPTEE